MTEPLPKRKGYKVVNFVLDNGDLLDGWDEPFEIEELANKLIQVEARIKDRIQSHNVVDAVMLYDGWGYLEVSGYKRLSPAELKRQEQREAKAAERKAAAKEKARRKELTDLAKLAARHPTEAAEIIEGIASTNG
jgi:hypothetical protein